MRQDTEEHYTHVPSPPLKPSPAEVMEVARSSRARFVQISIVGPLITELLAVASSPAAGRADVSGPTTVPLRR